MCDYLICCEIHGNIWLSSRRLLDKQQRVEAIAASLEQSGADPSQRAEVEEMITPSERAQLARVKHITNKYVLLNCHTFLFEVYSLQMF